MDFLIFVPPRSKSSWIANFFTYKNSFCYHEALSTCTTLEQFAGMKKDGCVTGNADSSLFVFSRQVVRVLPDAKLVLVNRKRKEIEKSLMEMFTREVATVTAANCEEAAGWLREQPNCLEIDFEEIKEEQACKKMWEHCVDGDPFDRERWKMVSNFKIQVDKVDMSGGTILQLLKNVRGY